MTVICLNGRVENARLLRSVCRIQCGSKTLQEVVRALWEPLIYPAAKENCSDQTSTRLPSAIRSLQ